MGRLTCSTIASLDGYSVDAEGRFDWAQPDEEVHAHVDEAERAVGTYLYGRRMYEVMRWWQDVDTTGEPQVLEDYAQVWRAADKVVFSRTLDEVTTPRTRLEREFEPEAVRALVAGSERDVSVGGPGLAAQALRAGLVDELATYVVPHVVGGGTRWLPDGLRLRLQLLDERRFTSGVVWLRYAVVRD